MKIADMLVLAGAFVVFAAEPRGGVSPVPDAPAPVTAGSTAARRPAVCPKGASQDLQCLDAAGAIGSDGAVNYKKAKALRDIGACPCRARPAGGTATIPSGTDN